MVGDTPFPIAETIVHRRALSRFCRGAVFSLYVIFSHLSAAIFDSRPSTLRKSLTPPLGAVQKSFVLSAQAAELACKIAHQLSIDAILLLKLMRRTGTDI
jgi:hypothetical protein